MPQQVMTPQVALDLAEKVESQRITKIDVERQKFGKNKGKIFVKWEEGNTGSVSGESFAAGVLRELAHDLQAPKTIIALINVKKTGSEGEFIASYAAAKESTDANH